jgi:hypothetical protein
MFLDPDAPMTDAEREQDRREYTEALQEAWDHGCGTIGEWVEKQMEAVWGEQEPMRS